MSWITRMCAQGTTEEKDLENIQDAIVDYLSVVDEHLLKKVKHVTWKLREMPKLSGVSHKRAIKAFEKTGFSFRETMKTCNDDKWRTNLDHSLGKSYQRLYYG